MKIQTSPSHVALLVPSVRKAADFLKKFEFETGEAQEWEGEGTLEIYVEVKKRNSLLLMEPVKPGAYQRAMQKRGPGLHHLAIDVLNLDAFILSIAGSGWLLHPQSIETMKHKTAYLARPGFPGLIEVQEREKLLEGPLFIEKIAVPIEASLVKLAQPLGLENVFVAGPGEIVLGGHRVALKDLY